MVLGAEELSDVLNHIFQPTVSLVYAHGGFIPYFAGDSFTAIFPIQDSSEAPAIARKVLQTAQAMLTRFEREQADANSILSEHHIGLKVGLSEGEVHWGIVGEKRKSYYFRAPRSTFVLKRKQKPVTWKWWATASCCVFCTPIL